MTVRADPGAPWTIATAKPATRSAAIANSPGATGPRSARESSTSFSNGFVGSGLKRPLIEPLPAPSATRQASATSRCSEEAGLGSVPALDGCELSGAPGSKTSL